MAYLDNSGDIILDAVLTDAGRKRLAEGDGSFKITKYAFGDDEIDYGNYNASNTSGSAYYDIEILQTPILEAFTNNTANMKSKLITLTNNNILYLPVIKLNQEQNFVKWNKVVGSGSFVVSVDGDTSQEFYAGDMGQFMAGDFPGAGPNDLLTQIRVDQGLDTTEISNAYQIDAELQENQYIVEIDNRLGSLTTADKQAMPVGASQVQGNPAAYSFIDDDNIASYYLSTGDFVEQTPTAPFDDLGPQAVDNDLINRAIAGPRGTHCAFKIKASTNLRTSTYLFERLGSVFSFKANAADSKTDFYYIDTIIRITGATTGYKIDIPVRFVKKK